ncbi:MAG: gluconate 2-dehydrogenase subunit 3 family protein [Gemmatimonadaceae bacterium]|nr:gluconate 2-dehydrogenase subunit 3 family protein [Gemmatimonadaceae bacterium]
MTLSRRSLLTLAALAAVPRQVSAALPDTAWTRGAWARALGGDVFGGSSLTALEESTIRAIANAVIPRTDTPGAIDVGAPAFIGVLFDEWASDDERTALRTGLAELDARANAQYGKGWAALDTATAEREIAWAEASTSDPTAGQRALRRVKSWTVHAWITSEVIQTDVLHRRIIHGGYEGCVEIAPHGGSH